MNINTMTFAARDFSARRGASDEHIPKWICEERATKSGRKRTAARRVAPNLACGVVARRLQPHFGGCALLAPRDCIAEKDAGETLRQNNPAPGRPQGDGRVLAGAAAPEVFSTNHNGMLAVELTFLHEADGIERVGQPTKRVAAEFLVFVRNCRN